MISGYLRRADRAASLLVDADADHDDDDEHDDDEGADGTNRVRYERRATSMLRLRTRRCCGMCNRSSAAERRRPSGGRVRAEGSSKVNATQPGSRRKNTERSETGESGASEGSGAASKLFRLALGAHSGSAAITIDQSPPGSRSTRLTFLAARLSVAAGAHFPRRRRRRQVSGHLASGRAQANDSQRESRRQKWKMFAAAVAGKVLRLAASAD